MIDPKPGNQPDPDDMAASLDVDGDVKEAHPRSELDEEEAAKLGDFA